MTRIQLLLFAAGVCVADLLTGLPIVERLPIGSVRPVIDGWRQPFCTGRCASIVAQVARPAMRTSRRSPAP